MKTVTRVIDCYDNTGKTKPLLVILDDGTTAFVKYPNNPEGNLILINEYISYSIAAAIGIKTPFCGLCNLNNVYESENNFIEKQKKNNILTSNNYGICFYSTLVRKSLPFQPSIITHIKEKYDFIKLIIFDHLIYNKDRHRGNLLIETTPSFSIVAIDHSHVFKNQAIWDKISLIQGINENDYLDTYILKENSEVYTILLQNVNFNEYTTNSFVNLVKQALTPTFFDNIIKKLPEQWLTNIKIDDIIELKKYLSYRVSHIDDIVKMIIKERRHIND